MRITAITSQNRDTSIYLWSGRFETNGTLCLYIYIYVLLIKYQELLNNTHGFRLKCPVLHPLILKHYILQETARLSTCQNVEDGSFGNYNVCTRGGDLLM